VDTLDPFTGHELWAEVYDAVPNPLLALEERELSAWLGKVNGLSVADIGCGTGRWMKRALSLGAGSAVGVDFSPKMLGRAAQEARLMGNLVLANASAIPLRSSSVDLAICGFVLSYLHSLESVAKELHRILKPNGSLFCSDLHPSAHQLGWKRAFKCGDRCIEITSTVRQPVEIEKACGKYFDLQRQVSLQLGESERPLFERAGKTELFEEVKNVPAVVLFQWQRRD
jgi:malonyl-CoA O-methyltransferase